VRALVGRELAGSFARIRAMYAPPGAARETPLAREESRWGLMPASRYGEVLATTLDRDYVPRLSRLGFDARAAWLARPEAVR
jgi:hypothetical protein